MSAGRNRSVIVWFHLLVIAGVVVLLYAGTFYYPFTFDDIPTISENDAVRNPARFLKLRNLFKPRNLVYLTLALTYRFWQLDVFWYHAGNTLIHLLAAWTAYFLALALLRLLPGGRIDSPRTAALFTALVFAAHPLQTQAVTYIIQRMASMAALFFMLSVLLYVTARSLMSQRHAADGAAAVRGRGTIMLLFLLSAVSGIMAVMCKENAAGLPGVILLIEFVLFDRSWRTWKKKSLWLGGACCVLLIVLLGMTGVFRKPMDDGFLHEIASVTRLGSGVSRSNYLCTQFSVIVIYLRLLILPAGQCVDWMYPFKTGFFDELTPLAFLFLAALAGGALRALRKNPLITLAAGWFFITLAVESSVIPITDALVEHRLYLPLFGFALLLPWLVFRLLPTRRRLAGSTRRWAAGVTCIILVAALGTATCVRNRTWRSQEILWRGMIAQRPHNYRAFNNLGRTLALQGRFEEAVNYIDRSLELDPTYAEALNNRGFVSLATGDIDAALDFTTRALQASPSFGKARQMMGNILMAQERYEEALHQYRQALPTSRNKHLVLNNKGQALAALGRLDKAVRQYRRALKKSPRDPDILTNLGLVLTRQGNYADAVRSYEKALAEDEAWAVSNAYAISNTRAVSHNGLGVTLVSLGQLERAEEHYAEAVQADPGFSEAFNNWGLLLAGQGRTDEAIRRFTSALDVDPDFAQAHNNLGVVLVRQGKLDEGAEQFELALQAQPSFADAHNNLGNLMTEKKQYDEAIHHYREALRLNPALETARRNLDIVTRRRGAAIE